MLFAGSFNLVFAKSTIPITFYDTETWKPVSYIEIEGEANGYNLAAADLVSDNKAEIIVAPRYGDQGPVQVYNTLGDKISEFYPYYESFSGGVSVDTGDFNGDGYQEIVVGAGKGGGAHVRILDIYGNPTVSSGFFAFDESLYREGISVKSGDITGDGLDEILVLTNHSKTPVVRIFTFSGKMLAEFSVDHFDSLGKLNLGVVDLSDDGYDEIIVSGGYGSESKIAVYLANGIKLLDYSVYNKHLRSGLMAVGLDVSGESGEEIITAPGFTGGPHIKIFNNLGELQDHFFTNHYTHDHGLNLAIGDVTGDGRGELLTVTQAVKQKDVAGRYIEINVTNQTFAWYDNGYFIDKHLTSTGKPSTPTRIGDFKALTKLEMAYGGDGEQTWAMPKWIGFYYAGYLQNGIHALPYINGRKEGSSSLGYAVSHGCVRLNDKDIEKVYKWVKLGDRISVVR